MSTVIKFSFERPCTCYNFQAMYQITHISCSPTVMSAAAVYLTLLPLVAAVPEWFAIDTKRSETAASNLRSDTCPIVCFVLSFL